MVPSVDDERPDLAGQEAVRAVFVPAMAEPKIYVLGSDPHPKEFLAAWGVVEGPGLRGWRPLLAETEA